MTEVKTYLPTYNFNIIHYYYHNFCYHDPRRRLPPVDNTKDACKSDDLPWSEEQQDNIYPNSTDVGALLAGSILEGTFTFGHSVTVIPSSVSLSVRPNAEPCRAAAGRLDSCCTCEGLLPRRAALRCHRGSDRSPARTRQDRSISTQRPGDIANGTILKVSLLQ